MENWQRRYNERQRKKIEKAERERQVMISKARKIAWQLEEKYGCEVRLTGSLLVSGKEYYGDIDLILFDFPYHIHVDVIKLITELEEQTDCKIDLFIEGIFEPKNRVLFQRAISKSVPLGRSEETAIW